MDTAMASIDWKKVCCPVDFSGPSASAMRVAADLCRRFEAELTLLYVERQPAKVLLSPAADPEYQLAEWRREAEQLGVRRVGIARASGDAAIAIIEFAARSGADLVVMGTHGRTNREHMLLGSVTEAVVRQARCPVLTVRGEWRGAQR